MFVFSWHVCVIFTGREGRFLHYHLMRNEKQNFNLEQPYTLRGTWSYVMYYYYDCADNLLCLTRWLQRTQDPHPWCCNWIGRQILVDHDLPAKQWSPVVIYIDRGQKCGVSSKPTPRRAATSQSFSRNWPISGLVSQPNKIKTEHLLTTGALLWW